MFLKVGKCVRCGARFTTGMDVHAEHKPEDKRAINEYVVWCGNCYPIKHEPIPEGFMPSPIGLREVPDGYKWTKAKGLQPVESEA